MDTTAPTRVSPGVTDRTPTEVGHEPVDPGTLSRPRRSGGGLILLGVGVLVTVGLAILAGMFIGRPRMGPADLECYIAAVEGGDWDTAAAVAARAGLVPEGPQARLVLAMDAALAGQDAEAASRLGDAQTLPDPLRSRARLLEGGLARRGPSGYTDAARAYGQALDCAGPGCTPILESARAGLMLACIAGEESARAPCSRSRAPAWSSSAERSLVRSVVLLRDGHEEGALDALRVGLETSGSLACTGSAALRVWADERERVERAGMAPLLDARGRASSRNRDDCQLFEEAGR